MLVLLLLLLLLLRRASQASSSAVAFDRQGWQQSLGLPQLLLLRLLRLLLLLLLRLPLLLRLRRLLRRFERAARRTLRSANTACCLCRLVAATAAPNLSLHLIDRPALPRFPEPRASQRERQELSEQESTPATIDTDVARGPCAAAGPVDAAGRKQSSAQLLRCVQPATATLICGTREAIDDAQILQRRSTRQGWAGGPGGDGKLPKVCKPLHLRRRRIW
jgi:hypothetical protein